MGPAWIGDRIVFHRDTAIDCRRARQTVSRLVVLKHPGHRRTQILLLGVGEQIGKISRHKHDNQEPKDHLGRAPAERSNADTRKQADRGNDDQQISLIEQVQVEAGLRSQKLRITGTSAQQTSANIPTPG